MDNSIGFIEQVYKILSRCNNETDILLQQGINNALRQQEWIYEEEGKYDN